MPNNPTYIIQQNPALPLVISPLPSVANLDNILIYTGGGGTLFPNLPNDLVQEPGLYYGGYDLLTDAFELASYESLNITVTKKNVLSTENSRGILDIDYPSNVADVTGQIAYYWDDVYTTPLGIYSQQGSIAAWSFNLDLEILNMQVNDVNVVPRTGDYIVLNYVPMNFAGYTNGLLNQRLPVFKGTEMYTFRIMDVLVVSGTGVTVQYQLTLDKSLKLINGTRFGVCLLNRKDTSIQKELFYKTFEQIEINRSQLLGDPYNNTTNQSKLLGRNHQYDYNGADSLGYATLLKGIINSDGSPFVVLDINDEIKDRISYFANTYASDNKPTDINFEFHLPNVMINENLYPSTTGTSAPVNATGDVIENIFITDPNFIDDVNLGKYSGLYLKSDLLKQKRFGFVMYDLRLIVMDDAELCTALSYNSNRNYTLPVPIFQPGSGNQSYNPGTGVSLSIVDASNSSPIVITTSVAYNLPRGTVVMITDVKGNTNANGIWYLDNVNGSNNSFKFELWQQLPTYVGGIRVPNTGTPVAGNSLFINNGVGNSGTVIGALPYYSYFYTYRLRNNRNNSVAPFAKTTDFNFATSGSVDNTSGSLLINIPMFNWFNQQNNLSSYDLGFEMFTTLQDLGYGVDIIIGKYKTDLTNLSNPTAIIGIEDVMCIALKDLITTFSGDPLVGMNIEVKKIQDYDNAVSSTNNLGTNYSYDIYANDPLYSYNINTLPDTLFTGNGLWTLGEVVFRKHVEINRAYFDIFVPATSWNDSTNPTYTPSSNKLITDKYISEVAILLDKPDSGDPDLKPVIYAKIAPAIKKNQDLDLTIQLSVDF